MQVYPNSAQDDDDDFAALGDAMRQGVAAAPEVYRPGEFWAGLNAKHLEMLRAEGIANFKRTVSHSYYDWLVTGLRDRQIRHALLNWLKDPTLSPLVNRLEKPPAGQEYAVSGSAISIWWYKVFVGAIWETARRDDTRGLTERLSEPEVGNPIRIRRRGQLISQDLANSIIEFTFAARSGAICEGCRVAELGAGYGRLAYVFGNAHPLTYCIFDVPPALAVAQWYLRNVLGGHRVVPYTEWSDFGSVESLLTPGVVAFFTPDQMEMFPDDWFDCMQTISTLPEMPAPQWKRFLELFAVKSRQAIFLKQWKQWSSADYVAPEEEDYRFPDSWRLVARRTDPVQPDFFNRLWLRSPSAAG